MHRANAMWWSYCANAYPQWFTAARVLELGSYDVNGSVRQFFREPAEYLGIDWRAGPGVDRVTLAHNFYGGVYDTIISASMLEHDPYWDQSLRQATTMLAPRGAMFLSWGAALNPAHEIATAPDNLFHSLKAQLVIDWCRRVGLYVQEFHYEYRLPFLDEKAKHKLDKGCVVLVALRSRADAPCLPSFDDLLPEDQV